MLSGIDVGKFKPTSTRAAVASKAAAQGATVEEIMWHVGWSRQSTFATYYNKQVTKVRPVEDVILQKMEMEIVYMLLSCY